MLTLYYKPSCPFCQRVLGEVEDLGIKMNLKDVSTDEAAADELIELGGKRQIPYLVDNDRSVSMYESGDIIAYLEEHYKGAEAKESFSGVRIHKSEESCDTCQ
ncbi:MAG: glutaredoxin 3 [Candidatus Paceibacteria bacterium]|jgi:glutaredoxin 3